MTTAAARIGDADFAAEVLADLYTYRRKSRTLAWLLWATLGWVGAHRFYLERNGTGLLMLLSLGGGFLWWGADMFLLNGMLRSHEAEQERRRAAGLPPLELAFMPPLSREVLERRPAWTAKWEIGGRLRPIRFVGDLLVLIATGSALGFVAANFGAYEAIAPVLVLVLVTAAGAEVARFAHVPGFTALVRWSHRLRLFYYYNKPGSPIALLFRPVTGAILAPFRPYARAEVRLYLQLGAVFTVLFLLEDVISALLERGTAALAPFTLLRLWLTEAATNFLAIYAFATPSGAVLTLYLLVRRTHTLPRILSLVTLIAIVLGLRI